MQRETDKFNFARCGSPFGYTAIKEAFGTEVGITESDATLEYYQKNQHVETTEEETDK